MTVFGEKQHHLPASDFLRKSIRFLRGKFGLTKRGSFSARFSFGQRFFFSKTVWGESSWFLFSEQKATFWPPFYFWDGALNISRALKMMGVSNLVTWRFLVKKQKPPFSQLLEWLKLTSFQQVFWIQLWNDIWVFPRIGEKTPKMDGLSLRIQVCPKKGINPTILLWGWDWDHQTYSREGYGSLGYNGKLY